MLLFSFWALLYSIFWDSLNKSIEEITIETNRVNLLTDEVRISAVSILKNQRKLITHHASTEQVDKIIELCERFTAQLHSLNSLYKNVEIKQVISKMIGYVDSLKVILNKASFSGRDTLVLTSIADLSDKILEAFSEFQDIQYFQKEERDKKIKNIIGETKRNMLYTLIITFVGTMLLSLVVPGKIALPFKKINDAIRELQDCNFDVSIYYEQDDEIGEIAAEINKMISNFKVFEELRADRINLERRKFDALANLVHKYILVTNARGNLIYMNNQLYSLLQVQSDDIIYKDIAETRIPSAVINVFKLAIKRRSKIENEKISFDPRAEHEAKPPGKAQGESNKEDYIVEHHDEHGEIKFEGFGTVIPIRGKESSLDYYLMVLSEEVIS